MAVLTFIEGENFSLTHSFDPCPVASGFYSHIHDWYEIFFLVKGDVDYIVEGNLYSLRPGAIMLMRSSETHKLVVNKSTEYERYVFSFNPAFVLRSGFSEKLLSPFKERGLGEKNLYLPSEFSDFSPLLHIKLAFAQLEHLDKKDVCLSALTSLLCQVVTAFNKKNEVDSIASVTEREIISFVNENLKGDISLSDIAKHMHMSPSQVSRIFKQATGTSVYNYILTKRLISFNKRINAGMSASEACRECGFRDYSSFYRLYKKRFGHSPTK